MGAKFAPRVESRGQRCHRVKRRKSVKRLSDAIDAPVEAGQVWTFKPRRGRRRFIRILRVVGRRRARYEVRVGQKVFRFRTPAEAIYIDVGRSGRPKRGVYETPDGWIVHYATRDRPASIALSFRDGAWRMPDAWDPSRRWTLTEGGKKR